MTAPPRYEFAIRDRETGEVHVSEASFLLTSELTRLPDRSEHHVVSVRGIVDANAHAAVRLLAILVRRLAGLLRCGSLDLAISTLREVVRLHLSGNDAEAWHLPFGKRAGGQRPSEAPDA